MELKHNGVDDHYNDQPLERYNWNVKFSETNEVHNQLKGLFDRWIEEINPIKELEPRYTRLDFDKMPLADMELGPGYIEIEYAKTITVRVYEYDADGEAVLKITAPDAKISFGDIEMKMPAEVLEQSITFTVNNFRGEDDE